MKNLFLPILVVFISFLFIFPTTSYSADQFLCDPDTQDDIGPGTTPGTRNCVDKGSGGGTLAKPKASPGAIPSVGKVDQSKVPSLTLDELVQNGVLISLALGGLIFFFMLIIGGLKYLNSGGDEKAVASARGTITNAFIGLVIMIAAFLIAQLLFSLFGIDSVTVTG